MKQKFLDGVKNAKEFYKVRILDGLKNSQPGKWYSKIKRISGQQKNDHNEIIFEEICNLNQEVQAEKIADFFFSTRNQFQPVRHEDLADHISDFDQNIGLGYNNDIYFENLTSPENVQKVIKSLNRKSSSVIGNLPMKLVQMFAEEL